MPWFDDSPTAPPQQATGWFNDTPTPQPPKQELRTKEQFLSTVKPEMLDAQGKFKAPNAGVNFMLEGLTPDDVYSSAKGMHDRGEWSDDNRLGKVNATDIANQMLDAGWREGPDNGGGFLGGVGRAVSGTIKGIASNPALMAAFTAGVGSALSSGVQSATGWSAGTSKAVSSGIINGAKTLANGGNLTDMAKSAVLSAAGGVAGNAVGVEVKDFTGSPIAAKIASDLTNTAVKGGDLASTLVTSGTGLAVNEITSNIDGFDKLSELQKGIINSAISSAIRGKKITPGLIADIMTKTQQTVKKAKA